jgi:hypothetical protein
MEKPYIPFYKPYGMSDEEYQHEINIAEQRYAEWEQEQAEEQARAEDEESDLTEDQKIIKTD